MDRGEALENLIKERKTSMFKNIEYVLKQRISNDCWLNYRLYDDNIDVMLNQDEIGTFDIDDDGYISDPHLLENYWFQDDLNNRGKNEICAVLRAQADFVESVDIIDKIVGKYLNDTYREWLRQLDKWYNE